VSALDVRLGGRQVLTDVSFEVGAGQFTGLIGSNGAGKTTLMRVVLGLQPPTRGTVRLPTASLEDGPPRRSVGYVPQKFLLDPDIPLRARDLVALGLDGHRLGLPLPSRSRRERVDQMLAAVGAEALADKRVGRLSGGEQQRVLVAHALVSRPSLLLLDEPLANLDIRSVREIVSLISRLAREQHVAVLISAHEVNPLLHVMDRVVYIASGRVASGPTEEVIRSEVLSRLYGQHVDVLHVHGRVLVVAGEGDPTAPGEDITVTHPHDSL
jgi:zinc/manganese transport system ATP-binding protein